MYTHFIKKIFLRYSDLSDNLPSNWNLKITNKTHRKKNETALGLWNLTVELACILILASWGEN